MFWVQIPHVYSHSQTLHFMIRFHSSVDDREYSFHFDSLGDPIIATHPESQISFPGNSVTLRIEAKGTAPLRYSWFCDSKVVELEEGHMLTLTDVREADSCSYRCCVENQVGKAESNPAELLVGEWQPVRDMFQILDAKA